MGLITLGVVLFSIIQLGHGKRYEPTWESLDTRPLPEWYDDIKFGIFMHWGVYSVPGFGSEWFWNNWSEKSEKYVEFMEKFYPPGFTYQQFAPDFKAEFFNATVWADILKNSGAKYVVLTSKHHEGFTLWPSKQTFSWNAKDIGPHRDIIKELSEAVRQKDMRFGLYYSLYEWYNPMYLADKKSGFKNRTYVVQKMLPDLYEIIENYKPDVIWSDGDWETEYHYFTSTEFLAWLYNDSPIKDEVVVNDRWGSNIPCHHGDFYTCTDRFNPGVLQEHKWENCMTVDKKSWGHRRNAELKDFKSTHELITDLVTTVSCGGNLLMNVGPTKDGTIEPIFQDRLDGIGKWLKINGEGIYSTKPWVHQNDTFNGNVWYTASKHAENLTRNTVDALGTIYAIVLEWPDNELLQLGGLIKKLSKSTKITMLGNEDTPLYYKEEENKVNIMFPNMARVKSKLSWTLKITNVNNNGK